MDYRQNTVKPEDFFNILSTYWKDQKNADLLVEREGIERIHGKIKDIDEHKKILHSRVTLFDETGFNIAQVIAIDGIFREDFSNC